MDPSTIFMIIAGVTATLLVVGVNMLISSGDKQVEERLRKTLESKADRAAKVKASVNLLKAPALDTKSALSRFLPSTGSVMLLYEQAHVNLEFKKFLMIAGGLAVTPLVIYLVFQGVGMANVLPLWMVPVIGFFLGLVPFFWLVFRKNQRVKQFVAAMPEALELTGRALRAGHGLASGLKMVADEMTGPIAEEFGQVFEEQNFGISMEESLRSMADRVPTMDTRFFVTAVVIQRATGGDLAEVLDKISRIIRQRFEIRGQVAALTGEGRLSGAVLLAMPPALLAYLFFTNRQYVMPLFTEEEMGRPMLIGAAVMQILGALTIRKIVDIKV